ncbi:hypothetical protein BVC80_1713g1 [Macleaya cordata]|uniref:Uncharacterized protein n=1 Tax=Macleaya cordata TaxID=56857 RepID=A0A200PPB8_MACCD|nr:hypothetical protein BVC80_1699g1 [Macleaya cordata]OVA04576.1 hypothetical protein BVC80_1713g1 [Macleaya cordata]
MSSGKEPSISSHPKRSGKEPSISSHPKRFGKEPSISSHPKRSGKEPSISSHPKRSRKEPSISSHPKRFGKELMISSEMDPRRSGKVVVGPQFTQPNKQDRDEELDNGDRKFYLLEDMRKVLKLHIQLNLLSWFILSVMLKFLSFGLAARTKVFDEPLPELITDAFGFITKPKLEGNGEALP